MPNDILRQNKATPNKKQTECKQTSVLSWASLTVFYGVQTEASTCMSSRQSKGNICTGDPIMLREISVRKPGLRCTHNAE